MRPSPPQDHHPTRAHPFRLFFILTAITIAACSPTTPSPPDLSRATTDSAVGRPDDLTAALATAQRVHALAVLTDNTDPETHTRTLTLLDTLDNRVVIRASAQPTDDPFAPTTYTVAVTYGLWGDPQRESKIIRTLQDRLRTLAQRYQDRHR